MSDALSVVTPWYPSASDPWEGTFVHGSTTELAAHRAITVVRSVDVTVRGGWDLGRSVRATQAAIPPDEPVLAHAPVPAGVAARRTGLPYAVVVHGIDALGVRQRLGTRPVALAAWRALHGAALVVAVSERVRQALPPGCRARAVVVHNGYDDATFTPASTPRASGGPVVLTVGNLGRRKGHDHVVAALPALLAEWPDLQWRVVGVGDRLAALEAQARRLGVHEHVCFLGRRPPSEVASELHGADLFVLPARYEALGCVYLEAMGAGVAVIGATGEGIAEIVTHGETGLLVDPRSPDAVLDAMRGALRDAGARRRIADAGRGLVGSNHTWRHAATRLHDALREAGL